ncbi:hypothetical protein CBR_g51990 [Chara braunii]|uniref:DDE Tnp4 domain-containing protein n=1 Tax=Chara braunii TaxID=69332 RepID=A0A388K6L0_CHABU|nr:hypothetical protein CBR_g51990 [Chara braunii]|eukprot:GBG65690.1 hypothetical protein CBR_g51990 [Chara braunii]
MDVDGDGVHDALSKAERAAVAAAVNMILIRCQLQRTEGRMRAAIRARRKKTLQSIHVDEEGSGAICDAVLQVCYAMGCGAFPRATPRWWMKRRTGGVWEDLRQCDDAMEDYFKDKLRMSPRVLWEIAETLSPFLQRRVTFYREPLQPDLIVAFALYRWASEETYESGTCSFGIGRKSGLVAVRDVTSALLSAYSDKISWPTGLQKAHPSEIRFDNKQKTARGAVERAFGRLKGMWRLFLRSHKTNMDTLPQQFVAVCILHNILIDAAIPFDDNLLWEVGPDGVRRRVDLGMHRLLRQMCMESSTGDALILRDALAERMGHGARRTRGDDDKLDDEGEDLRKGDGGGEDDGRKDLLVEENVVKDDGKEDASSEDKYVGDGRGDDGDDGDDVEQKGSRATMAKMAGMQATKASRVAQTPATKSRTSAAGGGDCLR